MVDFVKFRAELEARRRAAEAVVIADSPEDILSDFRASKWEIQIGLEPEQEPAPNGHSEPVIPDPGWESNARLTLIRMFEEVPELEVPFTFLTKPGCGEKYVQAIRVVLSRARASVKRDKATLSQQFKFLLKSIEKEENCDRVTVVRSKFGSLRTQETYKMLAKFLTCEEHSVQT